MTTLILQPILWQLNDKLTKRLLYVGSLMLLFLLLISPTAISAYSGLGHYTSEQLIGSGTSASLFIGNDDGPMVVSDDQDYVAPATTDAGWVLLRSVLTLLIAVGALILCIYAANAGNWVAVVILVAVGAVAIQIVNTMLYP